MSKMSASALVASSTVVNVTMTPLGRQRAANDSRSGRTRRFNVDFGMSPGDSLRPSTGSFRIINVERMERGYSFIASLITDLTRHQFFREVNVINKNSITSIQARREGKQAYGEPGLMQAYDQICRICRTKEDRPNYLVRVCLPN